MRLLLLLAACALLSGCIVTPAYESGYYYGPGYYYPGYYYGGPYIVGGAYWHHR